MRLLIQDLFVEEGYKLALSGMNFDDTEFHVGEKSWTDCLAPLRSVYNSPLTEVVNIIFEDAIEWASRPENNWGKEQLGDFLDSKIGIRNPDMIGLLNEYGDSYRLFEDFGWRPLVEIMAVERIPREKPYIYGNDIVTENDHMDIFWEGDKLIIAKNPPTTAKLLKKIAKKGGK